MAIFPQSGTAKKDSPAFGSDAAPPPAPAREQAPPAIADFQTATPPTQAAPVPAAPATKPATPSAKESVIAADLTIEGKIEGSGDIRIAGRFKGDVNVQGDLTIEHGAKLNGGVRARQVLVSGELEGNIESASLVELRDSAVLTGDLKAGSLTVAKGSRIRGHIECGWGDVPAPAATSGNGNGAARDKAASDKSSD